MQDLETEMCRIIKSEIADGFEDEGRSESAAHQVGGHLLAILERDGAEALAEQVKKAFGRA